MKTLHDVVRATEARGAKVVVETERGNPKLKDCLVVSAIPGSDTHVQLTGMLVGPESAVDDAAFEYYLADLDDPKTWLSSGVEPPSRLVEKKA